MKVEVALCDVCRAEVSLHWPICISAGKESSPNGRHLSADFCSFACLRSYLAEVESEVSA